MLRTIHYCPLNPLELSHTLIKPFCLYHKSKRFRSNYQGFFFKKKNIYSYISGYFLARFNQRHWRETYKNKLPASVLSHPWIKKNEEALPLEKIYEARGKFDRGLQRRAKFSREADCRPWAKTRQKNTNTSSSGAARCPPWSHKVDGLPYWMTALHSTSNRSGTKWTLWLLLYSCIHNILYLA